MATETLTLTPEIKRELSEHLARNPQIYAYTVWEHETLNAAVYQGHKTTAGAYQHKSELTDEGWSQDSVIVVRFTQLDEL